MYPNNAPQTPLPQPTNQIPDFFQNTPSPTPPPKKSVSPLKIALIALGVVIVIAGAVSAILLSQSTTQNTDTVEDETVTQVSLSDTQTQDIHTAANAYLQAIIDNDLETAYAYTSTYFQEYTTFEEFSEAIADVRTRLGDAIPSIENEYNDGDSEDPYVTVVYALGDEYLHITFNNDDLGWRVFSFQTSSVSVEDSGEDTE